MLLVALQRLAQLQRQSLNKQALQSCLDGLRQDQNAFNPHHPQQILIPLKRQMQWTAVQQMDNTQLDPSLLPWLFG